MQTILRRSGVILGAALALSLLSGGRAQAQAGPECYTAAVGQTVTDWSTSLTFPKFDTLGGTRSLTSIEFKLAGTTFSTIRIENTGSARTISATQTGTLTLTRPDNSTLVVTVPTHNSVAAYSAFDGTVDFRGPSGLNTGDTNEDGIENDPGATMNQDNDAFTSSSASDKALFTASFAGETINLGISAEGDSSTDAGGNIVTFFSQTAGADVEVCYYFDTDSVVPEPASMALLLGGILPLAGFRRRKK